MRPETFLLPGKAEKGFCAPENAEGQETLHLCRDPLHFRISAVGIEGKENTGHSVTRNTRREQAPEVKIMDKDLFHRANGTGLRKSGFLNITDSLKL